MWTCPSHDIDFTPHDVLQERLGWPGARNSDHDDKVIAHMAQVRAAVLQQRC